MNSDRVLFFSKLLLFPEDLLLSSCVCSEGATSNFVCSKGTTGGLHLLSYSNKWALEFIFLVDFCKAQRYSEAIVSC